MKSFGQKNFKFHPRVKSAILAIFQNGLGWLCPVSPALTGIEKIFLFCVPNNPLKDWKEKLERAHFLKVQSGRLTV